MATNTNTRRKKTTDQIPPETEPQNPPELGEEVPALFIKSRSKQGFRRCGHRFTAEGVAIALSALTDEEHEILANDPELIVEEVIYA